MAELAISAFAAMATAGTAVAGTAAAGAATATGLAAAGAGTLGTLQTVATIGSMVSTLAGGFMAYRESQGQAKFASLNAEADRLAAEERSLRIRRQYVEKVGQNRVAFAASGLDISSGAAIEGALSSSAQFETDLARTSGQMAAAAGEAQAASYRNQGVSKLVAAAGKAGGSWLDLRIDQARRG